MKEIQIDITPLDPYVETDTEISKETLLHRCTGFVSYQLLTMLKILIFYRIGKGHDGKMYLL